jgi:hypothetical protein
VLPVCDGDSKVFCGRRMAVAGGAGSMGPRARLMFHTQPTVMCSSRRGSSLAARNEGACQSSTG